MGEEAAGTHHFRESLLGDCFAPIGWKQSVPRMTEEIIREALRDCYDPEVPCNIVDLGLVYRVALELDRDAPGAGIPGVPVKHKVAIGLTLTSKGCPAHTQIIAQIEGRLSSFQEISQTNVDLVWEPAWTPSRISAEGRKLLGID